EGPGMRPNVQTILSRLKAFQQRTVNHAFDRLFLAPDSTSRFLVADEVGLGKTLVARGIIAKAIDHLWDDVPRIDIIYICSNASIARANLPKLQVGGAGERTFSLAARLTLLAADLAPREGHGSLADSRLNFGSFTPSTSFNIGRAPGRAGERHILYSLLVDRVPNKTPLMNLLQGNVKSMEGWRNRLKDSSADLEPGIAARFSEALSADTQLTGELDRVLEEWFGHYRKHYPV